MNPGFPIAPDPAIDLLSTAMAMLEPIATVGVHCCADADIASLLAAGPAMLSIPLDPRLVDVAGYLEPLPRGRRLHRLGRRATDGPIATSSERSWRQLSRGLVRAGQPGLRPGRAAPAQPRHAGVRARPAHAAVADRVMRLTREIGAAGQRAGRRQPLRPRRVASPG